MIRSQTFSAIAALATLALPIASVPAADQPAAQDHRMRVKITAKDFVRSIEFYGTLGMKPGFRHSPEQLELNWPGEMSGILIVNDPDGKLGIPPVTYLMMTVPSTSETVDQLRHAGFEGIGNPTNLGPAVIATVKDPDGNKIELISTSLKQPR